MNTILVTFAIVPTMFVIGYALAVASADRKERRMEKEILAEIELMTARYNENTYRISEPENNGGTSNV